MSDVVARDKVSESVMDSETRRDEARNWSNKNSPTTSSESERGLDGRVKLQEVVRRLLVGLGE